MCIYICVYAYLFFAHIARLHSIHDHLSKINRQEKKEKKLFFKSKYNWHTSLYLSQKKMKFDIDSAQLAVGFLYPCQPFR